jgi:hypothetical protein
MPMVNGKYCTPAQMKKMDMADKKKAYKKKKK